MLTDIHNYMGDEVLLQDESNVRGTIIERVGNKANGQIDTNENNQDDNKCVTRPRGSGKTTCFVKPFLLQAGKRKESVIVTDCNDELYVCASLYFRANGYIVHRINLKNPKHSDGWDLVGELRGEPEMAELLISCILANIDISDESEDYRAGVKQLVTAVALYAALSDKVKTACDIRDMMTQADSESYLDTLFNNIDQDSALYSARKMYVVFKQTDEDARSKILDKIAEVFKQVPEALWNVLSRPGADLVEPGEVPCAYFLELNPMGAYPVLESAFFSFLYYDLAGERKFGRGVPVNVVLNEFANIGVIPQLDKLMATGWRQQIHTVVVAQSIEQIKQRCSGAAAALLAQCPVRVCLGCTDVTTARYFSEQAGVEVVEGKRGEDERPFLTVDEALRLDINECLVALPKGVVRGEKCANMAFAAT